MTEIESLITQAGRYCLERHVYWSNRYQQEGNGQYPYSKSDYQFLPRCNILDTLLQRVLALMGKEFQSFEAGQAALKKIGMEELDSLGAAEDPLKKADQRNKTARAAMRDECTKFVEFISQQSPEQLRAAEPLPFERKLSEAESARVRKQLLETWNFTGDPWVPLLGESPKTVLYLSNDNLEWDDQQALEAHIKERIQTDKIFVVTEDRIDYEVDIQLLDIDLYETILCDQTFTWVVYGSHELATTFGGDWLLDKVHQLFENRKEKLNQWEWP